MTDNTQRPGNFAPYGAGLLASGFGFLVLLFSALSNLDRDPSDSIVNLSIAVGAPLILLAFAFLSAVPRRQREARVSDSHPDAELLSVIMTSAARRALNLDDQLKRSYTATFTFDRSSVSLWKGGSKPTLVGQWARNELETRATSMRFASNRVAALELSFSRAVIAVPVVKRRGVFNMPTGYSYIDNFCGSQHQK